MADPLTVALEYADAGYNIYPLAVDTTVPLKGSHGYKDATNDTATIRNWFNDHDYNIGLNLASSNLLVVDIDRGHASGTDGWKVYEKLYHDHNLAPLPTDTYIEKTKNGGLHFFFDYPKGTKVNNIQSAFQKNSGIDLITTGTPIYPTSIHGEQYKPLDGLTLKNVKPAPNWVLDQFKSKEWHYNGNNGRAKKYTGILLDEIVNGAPSGERNVFLTSMAGKMFSVGADPKTIYNLLLVINESFLDSPLPESEVNTVFQSMLKRESGVILSGES